MDDDERRRWILRTLLWIGLLRGGSGLGAAVVPTWFGVWSAVVFASALHTVVEACPLVVRYLAEVFNSQRLRNLSGWLAVGLMFALAAATCSTSAHHLWWPSFEGGPALIYALLDPVGNGLAALVAWLGARRLEDPYLEIEVDHIRGDAVISLLVDAGAALTPIIADWVQALRFPPESLGSLAGPAVVRLDGLVGVVAAIWLARLVLKNSRKLWALTYGSSLPD